MGMEENKIQKDIMDYLKMNNVFHFRNNTGRRGNVSYGFPGSADILGLLPNGLFLSIEVKTETGIQSDKQKEFEKNIAKNNGIYILARSLDDVIKGLQTGEESATQN